MGKRSDFKRAKGDFYVTPPSAVRPLIPHLPMALKFSEPCAGDGALIDALTSYGFSCVEAFDLEPKRDDILPRDFFDPSGCFISDNADFVITNPPWTRAIMHPMIDTYAAQKPTWLLFDADWMHTVQAAPYLKFCHKIVSVGRVSWMGNGVHGKDNAAWYLFDKSRHVETQFVSRAA